jgi:hypothetical protein
MFMRSFNEFHLTWVKLTNHIGENCRNEWREPHNGMNFLSDNIAS